MLTKEQKKFVELFIIIVKQDIVVPYEDSFESLITKNSFYNINIREWESVLYSTKTRMRDNYNEWLENIHSIDDLDDRQRSYLPEEPTKIVFGNIEVLTTTLITLFDEFANNIAKICYPVASDSHVQAAYDISASGFQASVWSFNESDNKRYNKIANNIMNELKLGVFKACDAFNESQLAISSDAIVLKRAAYHDSNGSVTKVEDNTRGHIIDANTVFERVVSLDTEHVQRNSKGKSASKKEIYNFFNKVKEKEFYCGRD